MWVCARVCVRVCVCACVYVCAAEQQFLCQSLPPVFINTSLSLAGVRSAVQYQGRLLRWEHIVWQG